MRAGDRSGFCGLASVVLIALTICGRAVAGDVDDLYMAQVPVTSQAEAERADALRAAFDAVLVKVTGRKDVGKTPRIQEAMRQPLKYVQQFFYQPLPTADAASTSRYTQTLRATFDPRATNDLLSQAGVAVWGKTRPTTLLWLAVEDGNDRYLLGGGGASSDSVRQVVDREAQRRAVPVLVPMMDLEDRNKVYFTDVWGDFQESILQASERYRAGAVLIGRLLHDQTGGWSARWSLYVEGAADQWSASAPQWADLIAAGIDGTADRLAQRYAHAIAGGGEKTADIVVANIRSLADYDRALSYLRGLDGVQAAEVLGLDDDRLSVRLQINSDRDAIARLIGFGSTLGRNAAVGQPGPPAGQALSYRLLP